MKTKAFTVVAGMLLSIIFCAGALADNNESQTRTVHKKIFNIAYSSDKIRPGETIDFNNMGGVGSEFTSLFNGESTGIKCDWGVDLTFGRTFAFHKKPLAGLLTIGLDVIFIDLGYTRYTTAPANLGLLDSSDLGSSFNEETALHKAEYSLQVGPSLTLTPGKIFFMSVYARYAPTFSVVMANSNYGGNYAHVFVGGASVGLGTIGVGAEARVGSCDYKRLGNNEDVSFEGGAIQSTGFRLFLQLRF